MIVTCICMQDSLEGGEKLGRVFASREERRSLEGWGRVWKRGGRDLFTAFALSERIEVLPL